MSINYQIIAFDLDGTLLDEDMSLSKENKNAIHTLTQMGVVVVPNSGRGWNEFPKELHEDPNIRYFIYSDGAVIYDRKTGQKNLVSLSENQCNFLCQIFAEYDTMPIVHYNGSTYIDAEKFNDKTMQYYRMRESDIEFFYDTATPTEEFASFCLGLKEVEMFCVFFRDDEELENCRQQLRGRDDFLVVNSIPHTLEVVSIHAGKGNALLRLAELLDIPAKKTIAVGDSVNDIDMVQKAGLGIAMKNACSELKAFADAIACENKHHIAEYLLNNIIRDIKSDEKKAEKA